MLIRCKTLALTAAALAVVALLSADARAQYSDQQLGAYRFSASTSRYSVQQQYNSLIRQGLNVGGGYSPVNQQLTTQLAQNYRPSTPATKPFTGANSGGGVTPYLSLSSPFSSTATNYYTQVRPQLQQQQANTAQQRQNARFQQQLTQMAARPPFEITGSQTMAPTGHAAVFQNTLNYYPQPQQRR